MTSLTLYGVLHTDRITLIATAGRDYSLTPPAKNIPGFVYQTKPFLQFASLFPTPSTLYDNSCFIMYELKVGDRIAWVIVYRAPLAKKHFYGGP